MDPEYIQVHVLENDLVNNDEGADHQRGVQGGRHKVTWTAGSLFTQWSPPEERMYELSFMSAKIMKLCTSAYSYILEHFEEVSLCNFPGAVNDGTKNHHRQRQTDGETGENCL
uniref:Kelch-like family member 10 n=1 Tax=Iconisemion striatum TaxID=60296 RepID=A0A1A7XYJ4_9TELE